MAVCKRCGKPARIMSDLCSQCIDLPVGDLISVSHAPDKPVVGVHGWLALLVFGLLVGFPLLSAGQLNVNFTDAERQYPGLVTGPRSRPQHGGRFSLSPQRAHGPGGDFGTAAKDPR